MKKKENKWKKNEISLKVTPLSISRKCCLTLFR